ncbi:MAG TPA: urease accessory UreF family protein, partial [Solirubrobacteraceae bacterium]|nr:urease accessory UreF family protein [Solirubrobacteraceae bacterium]
MGSAGAVATLLLADSRFPAGSYAHSLGLEQAVSEGLGVDGVAPFIGARLRLVAQPEAALSVAARRAAATLESGQASASATTSTAVIEAVLADLDDEHAARCPSPVLRDVARRLGSQLLRSAATAWPCATIDRYRTDSTTSPRPVAL